jgi:hypothetical protein
MAARYLSAAVLRPRMLAAPETEYQRRSRRRRIAFVHLFPGPSPRSRVPAVRMIAREESKARRNSKPHPSRLSLRHPRLSFGRLCVPVLGEFNGSAATSVRERKTSSW